MAPLSTNLPNATIHATPDSSAVNTPSPDYAYATKYAGPPFPVTHTNVSVPPSTAGGANNNCNMVGLSRCPEPFSNNNNNHSECCNIRRSNVPESNCQMGAQRVFNHPVHSQHSHANVVPLALLGRWPALVECPGCRGVAPTSTKHVAGKGSHWMATMFFFTTAIFTFVPYVTPAMKDVEHHCLRCGRHLATNRFGGGTQAKLM
ncbi:hypothetical protein PspLS_01813 [Pyricularia sp. CBS 133598]|nr:hypothetical protein PspLS_01813 [Pyricularia sp. CBS 133598]